MRHERASRRTAAGIALAFVVSLLAALALAACGGGDEEKTTPTATLAASPTAGATKTPTPTARQDVKPVQKPGAGTPTPTPQPSPAVQPTLPPSPAVTPPAPPPQSPSPPPPAIPSWQTSAPREPVLAGTVVELGIRNANGAPGETYPVGVQVNLPDGTPVNMEGQIVGADWTYFYVSDTYLAGIYTVYFGVPQSDDIYAEDSFMAAATVTPTPPPPPSPTQVPTPSWQTSAPRTPVGIGEVVEVGLRNKYGQPGECYTFLVEVYDPVGDYASAEDTVCADEWTDLTYEYTYLSGIYYVYYSIGGQYIAQDYFEVAGY